MKAVVNAIATSITSEVTAPSGGWTIKKYERVWRNPEDNKVLCIYGAREFPSDAKWTGGRQDIFEIIVEYAEPSDTEVLDRDEASELALYDVASSLKEWADNHQAGFGGSYHSFDWVGTDHSPIERAELLTRYFQMRFHARINEDYGS